MARAIFINTILAGKLGDSVYARNKAGYYVRGYSVPVDANSVAQQDARANFSTSVAAWHLLTSAQKSIWNTYAKLYFRPKFQRLTTAYSGFNAFISLYNSAKNAQRKWRTYRIYSPPHISLSLSFVNFTPNNSPAPSVFSANIQDFNNNPLSISLKAIRAYSNGNGVFTLKLHSDSSGLASAPLFIEPNTSLPVGFVLTASNILSNSSSFCSNPNHTIIGAMRPPTIIGGWTPGESELDFNFYLPDASIPDHKLKFNAGDTVRYEFWAVGQSGPSIRIGEKIHTLTA